LAILATTLAFPKSIALGFAMSILVYDPIEGGHHADYRRAYAEDLKANGEKVVLCGPAAEKKEYSSSLAEFIPTAAPKKIKVRLGPVRPSLQTLRNMHQLAAQIRQCRHAIEMVFLPMLDDFTDAWISYSQARMFIGKPFTGVWFNAAPLRFGGRKNHHTLIGGAPIGMLDEGVYKPAKKALGVDIVSFPDFATVHSETSALAKALRRWAGTRSLVVLCGALGAHKGIEDLYRLAEKRDDIAVFVGGRFIEHQVPKSFLKLVKLSNVRCHKGFLSALDFDSIIRHSDAIWLGYSGFASSSNVLRKAAECRICAIVRDGALLSERVRKFGLGVVFNDEKSLLTLDLKHVFDARVEHFLELHSRKANRAALQKLLALCRLKVT